MGLQQESSELGVRFECACARVHSLMEVSRPLVSVAFAALPTSEQERVLAMVEATASCGESMVREGLSPSDAGSLSWRVLAFMGLKPDSSAYTLYKPNDVIEVYNSAHKLIFASLNFLKISAYPLDSLYSRPWTELWGRSPDVMTLLWKTMCDVLDEPAFGTRALSLEPDVTTEILTGRQAVVRTRGFSPIRGSHGELSVLCVNEILRVLPSA